MLNNKLLIGMLIMTPHADPARDSRSMVNEDALILYIAVDSIETAEKYAHVFSLLNFDRIELCPAFHHEDVARIKTASGGRVPVGVVRFDLEP